MAGLSRVEKLKVGSTTIDAGAFADYSGNTGTTVGGFVDISHRLSQSAALYAAAEAGRNWDTGGRGETFARATGGLRFRF